MIIDSKEGFCGSVMSNASADLIECPQNDNESATLEMYSV